MCGRSSCTLQPEDIQQQSKAVDWENKDKFRPTYNGGPKSFQPVLYVNSDGKRVVKTMRWGLVPCYWKESEVREFKTINARSETVTTQNFWKRLLPNNRCVVLVDGYFEWKQDSKGEKHPYYIHFPEKGKLLPLAGLYDYWTNEEGEKLYTYTVITCDASKDISFIHDRMPVILRSDDDIEKWVNCKEYKIEDVVHLMKPFNAGDSENKLEYYEVPNIVNSWKNNSPDCIKPLSDYKPKLSILNYFSKVPKQETKVETKEEEKVKLEEDDLPELEEYDDLPSVENVNSNVQIKRENNGEESDDDKQAKKRKL